jgi:hypothetical protein
VQPSKTKRTRPPKIGLAAIPDPARRRAAAEKARLASLKPKRLKKLKRTASQVENFIKVILKERVHASE